MMITQIFSSAISDVVHFCAWLFELNGVIAAVGVIVFMIYFWISEKLKKKCPKLVAALDIAIFAVFVCAIALLID